MENTTKFAKAPEVRKFLKTKGFDKVKVRWGNNPFGGDGRFWVTLTDIPKGVACVYDSGTENTPERTFTSDKGVTAKRFSLLREALQDTNASVD